MEVIVGTTGHIDHGKTALVKALTGIDADRLPEEKQRGITIDIGFAELDLGDLRIGFVDVPGHERFIKNMLAGASGIDLVMLVIAADEGVMPQTREHFDICRLLGINAGVVVLTKTDLVDPETLELAKLDAAELVAGSFLENAPVTCVSARIGEGVDELKEALFQITADLPARNDQLIARLPIDRSFSMKGFGAVVTGTLASGKIAEGTDLELLPDGKRVRVRGLQTHGRAVKIAEAGQRVAVNLGGIDQSKVARGMLLAEPDVLRPTQIFDAEIEVLPDVLRPLKSRQRVRIHIGTVEVLARIQVLNDAGEIAAGATCLAQVRLEMPIAAISNERFIVRNYSPQATIAGGKVIDPFAQKHRRKEFDIVRHYLHDMVSASGDNAESVWLLLGHAGASGLSLANLRARTALKKEVLTAAIDAGVAFGKIVDAAGQLITFDHFDALAKMVKAAIDGFHKRDPLAKGISREALRESVFDGLPPVVFQSVIAALESSGIIVADKETIRLASHHAKLSPAETGPGEKILVKYQNAGLEVPRLEEALTEAIAGTKFTQQDARKFFQLFLDSGEIVKVTEEFYFSRKAIDGLAGLLREFAAKTNNRSIDVPKFKEVAGVSRKYAIPLLEYFDRERITRREGDKRLIL